MPDHTASPVSAPVGIARHGMAINLGKLFMGVLGAALGLLAGFLYGRH